MMEMSIGEVTTRLIGVLGPTLVASLAGSRDVSRFRRWSLETEPVSAAEEEKIRCAMDVWDMVSNAEGDDIARLWFIGGNPWLGDKTPITGLRTGRLAQVRVAAQALVDDSFSG